MTDLKPIVTTPAEMRKAIESAPVTTKPAPAVNDNARNPIAAQAEWLKENEAWLRTDGPAIAEKRLKGRVKAKAKDNGNG